jgi:acyl dehydratase
MESGLWWEDLAAGGSWRTGTRMLTAADLDRFSELSGDRNALHLDDAYARARGFAGRIAPGVLGMAIATGLLNRLGLTRGTLVALLGTTWTFLQPLYPGAVLHADIALGSATPTSRADRGIVILNVALLDDAGTVYQRGDLTMLVRRRGAA